MLAATSRLSSGSDFFKWLAGIHIHELSNCSRHRVRPIAHDRRSAGRRQERVARRDDRPAGGRRYSRAGRLRHDDGGVSGIPHRKPSGGQNCRAAGAPRRRQRGRAREGGKRSSPVDHRSTVTARADHGHRYCLRGDRATKPRRIVCRSLIGDCGGHRGSVLCRRSRARTRARLAASCAQSSPCRS